MKTLLTLATTAFLVGGCVTERIVYVTPEPGAAEPAAVVSTPEPTVAPTITPEPTPEPTKTPTVDTRWTSFYNWQQETHTEYVALLNTFTRSLDSDDGTAGYIPALAIKSLAEDGLDWLDGHEPADCYKSIWEHERLMLSRLRNAMTYWIRFSENYPFGSPDDAQRAIDGLEKSKDTLDTLTRLLENAGDDDSFCRGVGLSS